MWPYNYKEEEFEKAYGGQTWESKLQLWCMWLTSTRQSLLWHHIKVKHDGLKELNIWVWEMLKQLCCDRCDHINTKKKNLKRHMGDKYERVKYNCDACDITSTRQSLLWHHIKVKHDGLEELKHFCPQCDRIATHQYSLQLHIQTKHERNIRIVYSCDHCGYESFS